MTFSYKLLYIVLFILYFIRLSYAEILYNFGKYWNFQIGLLQLQCVKASKHKTILNQEAVRSQLYVIIQENNKWRQGEAYVYFCRRQKRKLS